PYTALPISPEQATCPNAGFSASYNQIRADAAADVVQCNRDTAERGPQSGGRRAEGESDGVRDTELLARHDEDDLLDTKPLCELARVDRCREGSEADHAGGGPLPGEELLLLEPCLENGDSVANVSAGSLEQARPDSRLEGEGREAVAWRGRRDGRVVSPCPELADLVRRRDGPADAQPRQSVGLGQRPGRHDARVAAEEAGRLP